jgi:serine-protein kinase ATM
LQSLAASDKHDDNVLRLVALWLEFADSNLANSVIAEFLPKVASRKFARLMNQLCSRLQADDTVFQKLLADLIFRICRDHPYHGLYQLYSNTTQPRLQDDATKARQSAAVRLARRLKADKKAELHWAKVKQAHDLYEAVAMYRDRDELQPEHEYDINKFPMMADMAKKISKLGLPPATMSVTIRADGDYTKVPTIIRFGGTVKIAGGLSAPKIVSAYTSDGVRYRQLVRSTTLRSQFHADNSLSSRAGQMTCARMPSWSKYLSKSADCSGIILRHDKGSYRSGSTKWSH